MSEITSALGRIQSIQQDIATTSQMVREGFADLLAQAMGAVTSPEVGVVPGNPLVAAGLDQAIALGHVGARDGSRLLMPVQGDMGSGFGPRVHPILGTTRNHDGVDISAPSGTPIVAAGGGKVSFAGVMGGYGNSVIIDHGNGMQTLYAHQSELLVKEGQPVFPGQRIGSVGSTGLATGPHLHFEVRIDGEAVDPVPYLV